MSVYAENLLRELVALGVEVVLVSQYRDDDAGTRVYGGGPPVRVPEGVRAVGVPSRGEAVDLSDPTGFALACQTDKGYGPDVDYLALRRAEDAAAMRELGVAYEHLDLAEAPHRGYDSATALFAGVRPDDDVHLRLRALLEPRRADLWLAPQGLGAHVDHLQVVRAVAALAQPTAWWCDAPYVLRAPDAAPSEDLPGGLAPLRLPADHARRDVACACYASQLGYQFGRDSDLPVLDAMQVALARLDEPLLADVAAHALLDA